MLAKWITFIKAHERLLLGLMLALLLWWGWGQWVNHEEHQLQVNADLKRKELDDAKTAANQAATNVAQSNARSATVDANALAAINRLQAKIAELDKELAARQKSDASLTDQQLANRWASLTGLASSDLLLQPGGGLAANHAATVITVQQLERIPSLEQKVIDLTGVINQREGQIAAKNDLIASMKDETDKLKIALAKAEPACEAQVKLAVQQERDRKAKGNWLIRGIVFVGGIFLGHRL